MKLEHYFVDGTKIEANANRYTFVWKQAVEKNKAKLEATIRDLITQIDAVDTAEDAAYGDRDLEDVIRNRWMGRPSNGSPQNWKSGCARSRRQTRRRAVWPGNSASNWLHDSNGMNSNWPNAETGTASARPIPTRRSCD